MLNTIWNRRILVVLVVVLTSLLVDSSAYAAIHGLWRIEPSMLGGRLGHAVIAHGEYIYAIGGEVNGQPSTSVERVRVNPDGSLGAWEVLATSMNRKRPTLDAVLSNNWIYALGGDTGGVPSPVVERAEILADGTLGPWLDDSPMTTFRIGPMAVAAGNYIYAIGGGIGAGYSSTVERALVSPDGSLGSWEVISNMNIPRAFAGVVASHGYIYLIGGENPTYLTSVERAAIYPDGSLGPWEFLASSLPQPRSRLAVVVVNDYVYVLGGDSSVDPPTPYTVLQAVINPDGSLGLWEEGSPMNYQRALFDAAGVGGWIYAVGSQPYNFTPTNAVERAAAGLAINSTTTLYVHGTGPNNNPPVLYLDDIAPGATTAKYKDSTNIHFSGGNPWSEIGVWPVTLPGANGALTALGDLHLWLGLKNGDDQGTNFDLHADVYLNGTLMTSGEALCIMGLTRNASRAKEIVVPFWSFLPTTLGGVEDEVSIRLLTRIGTDGAGARCGGHSNAAELRVYFDSVSRSSRFEVAFGQ